MSCGNTFGEVLRLLRKRAGMTQTELGDAVGYSTAQICRLESGARRPNPSDVQRLFVPMLQRTNEPTLVGQLVTLSDRRGAAFGTVTAVRGFSPQMVGRESELIRSWWLGRSSTLSRSGF